MRVKVRTQSEQQFVLEVSPQDSLLILKNKIQLENSIFVADKYRFVFEGRILDEDNLQIGQAGVEDGNVLLMIPKPQTVNLPTDNNNNAAATFPSNTPAQQEQSNLIVQDSGSLTLQDRELAQLLAALALSRQQSGQAAEVLGINSRESPFYELQQRGQQLEVQREGDVMDFALGFTAGLCLGFFALFCMMEQWLSRKARAGVLLGFVISSLFTLTRFADYADGPLMS
eukprot:TRINITY_DN2124_c0_g1_i1.p8 TRINITY_DN2124_c0_g1~~TRINITY_DN2124_c0_g1_i1.p8  ORF type:complete len:258 (+),score=30.95 TRINITY_DN2124_c0_g1_i1:91-774(+)